MASTLAPTMATAPISAALGRESGSRWNRPPLMRAKVTRKMTRRHLARRPA
jgi:hypothetical protein